MSGRDDRPSPPDWRDLASLVARTARQRRARDELAELVGDTAGQGAR